MSPDDVTRTQWVKLLRVISSVGNIRGHIFIHLAFIRWTGPLIVLPPWDLYPLYWVWSVNDRHCMMFVEIVFMIGMFCTLYMCILFGIGSFPGEMIWRIIIRALSLAGTRFNIEMSPYSNRDSQFGYKTTLRLSYLNNGISYTCKAASWYWKKGHDVLKGHPG